jgi:high-affinity iron transporter
MVIAAASNTMKNSKLYIICGSFIGVVGSIILAAAMPRIDSLFSGTGQEIFNSAIIFTTVLMLSFTILYMQNHAKKIKSDVSDITNSDQANIKPKIILIMLIAAAIFREGAEIVLFLYSLALSAQLSLMNYILGIAIGTIAAGFCSFLFYKGLLRTKKIFRTTSLLFMLVASGLAAEGFGILIRSGIITFLSETAWDSSWIISNDSWTGKIMKILISYNSRPSILEVVSFIATFSTLFFCNKVIAMKASNQSTHKVKYD